MARYFQRCAPFSTSLTLSTLSWTTQTPPPPPLPPSPPPLAELPSVLWPTRGAPTAVSGRWAGQSRSRPSSNSRDNSSLFPAATPISSTEPPNSSEHQVKTTMIIIIGKFCDDTLTRFKSTKIVVCCMQCVEYNTERESTKFFIPNFFMSNKKN